jgi:hypothetical protein
MFPFVNFVDLRYSSWFFVVQLLRQDDTLNGDYETYPTLAQVGCVILETNDAILPHSSFLLADKAYRSFVSRRWSTYLYPDQVNPLPATVVFI